MEKRADEFLQELGYGELADLDMFDGSESVETKPVYQDAANDLNIWAWRTDSARGFIRADSAGMRAISDTNREWQLGLAALNADLDIRVLAKYISESDMEIAMEDAKQNEWGFRDGQNIWDEEI